MSIVFDTDKFLQYQCNDAGFLVGLSSSSSKKLKDTVIVGYFSSPSHSSSRELLLDLQEGEKFISSHYPAGCDLVGVYYKLKEGTDFDQSKLPKDFDKEKNVLLIINSDNIVKGYRVSEKKGLIQLSVDKNVKDYVNRNGVTFRLTAQFKCYLPYKDLTESVIVDQLQQFISRCVLWLPGQQVLLEDEKEKHNVFTPTGLDKPPVVVELLQKSPPSSALYPLTVTMTPMTTPTLVLPVTFDLIGLFCNDIDTRLVAKQLRNRLQEQIKLIAQTIMVDKATNDQGIHSVSFFHFNLPNQHVPITVPYPHLPLSTDTSITPSPLPDSSLLSLRAKFHQTFCLPTNRPFLRKTNRQWSPWKQETRLFDPHVSLNLTEGGEGLALVNGSYLYYHYMQEKFNDKGWGCAYRSLQTIWSWFRCQGYTDVPVPTHREIQQTLVDCGDKEKPFIGSSEWIGSIEVSTVLNHSLQIESRIHHCSRGADIAGTGRLLQHHFRNQGTPVMIGGGVLAHTILGVDYDEQSGDIKFLILDPHYTGPEDINLINGKGCGWKGMNFWDQNASYNLCMPIRPQEI